MNIEIFFILPNNFNMRDSSKTIWDRVFSVLIQSSFLCQTITDRDSVFLQTLCFFQAIWDRVYTVLLNLLFLPQTYWYRVYSILLQSSLFVTNYLRQSLLCLTSDSKISYRRLNITSSRGSMLWLSVSIYHYGLW